MYEIMQCNSEFCALDVLLLSSGPFLTLLREYQLNKVSNRAYAPVVLLSC
jgi:hypothetical protein